MKLLKLALTDGDPKLASRPPTAPALEARTISLEYLGNGTTFAGLRIIRI
jgi:hypothetical protein